MYRRVLLVILAIALLLMIAYKQNWFPFAPDQADLNISEHGPTINEPMPDTEIDEPKGGVTAEDPAEESKQQTPDTNTDNVNEQNDNNLDESKQLNTENEQIDVSESGNTAEKQMQQAFDAGRGVWLLFTAHT